MVVVGAEEEDLSQLASTQPLSGASKCSPHGGARGHIHLEGSSCVETKVLLHGSSSAEVLQSNTIPQGWWSLIMGPFSDLWIQTGLSAVR